MSSICRYYEECLLRDAEFNPFRCDACGNVSYELWEYGEPTGRIYKGPCDMYEPMPDVKALKALASMVDDIGVGCVISREGARNIASRIRVALGEMR